MTLLMHAAAKILQDFNERNINFEVSFLCGGGERSELSLVVGKYATALGKDFLLHVKVVKLFFMWPEVSHSVV